MAERGSLTLLADSIIGALAAGILGAVNRLDRRRTANFAGALLRKIGPLLPEHRIGRDNLRAAFPEKSDAEIEQILAGVWDNLGRITVEFAHLHEFCIAGAGPQTADVVTYRPEMLDRFSDVTHSSQAMLCFAAHLANWEIPAIGAKAVGAKAALLYRRPNVAPVSDLIVKLRTPLMGELVPNGLSAPVQLARLAGSGVHVGMLVDQHYTKGVEVIFFGRRCMANPLIALLARQTGCPIRGMRAIRKADRNSFSLEMTDPIEPARDAEGQIDVAGTMQRITSVVEGWIREHPEQWLWLHRRWR
jgi:Kdo2-lipid IVA lauroyltransferase/acyltransferase